MPRRPVKGQEDEGSLIGYIRERENIRKRKEAGEHAALWTDDPILQKYRFTNVRRRHDRVSRWLLQHVLSQYGDVTPVRFVLFTALCRWVNWPPSIAAILKEVGWPGPDDYGKVARVLKRLMAEDQKVWTGAYMVKSMPPQDNKADFVVEQVIQEGVLPVAPMIVEAAAKFQVKRELWRVLMERRQWGSFMAGQIVDDWSWTPMFGKKGAKDNYTWAPQGPGSIRGLNRFLGREPLNKLFEEMEWLGHLHRLRLLVINKLGDEFSDLTAHDCQSCLCEFDKYLRVKLGEGRPRSMYVSETAFTVEDLHAVLLPPAPPRFSKPAEPLPLLPWTTKYGASLVPELEACLESGWDFTGERLVRLKQNPAAVRVFLQRLVAEEALYGRLNLEDFSLYMAVRTDYKTAYRVSRGFLKDRD
jgi:hypothetical protein